MIIVVFCFIMLALPLLFFWSTLDNLSTCEVGVRSAYILLFPDPKLWDYNGMFVVVAVKYVL